MYMSILYTGLYETGLRNDVEYYTLDWKRMKYATPKLASMELQKAENCINASSVPVLERQS